MSKKVGSSEKVPQKTIAPKKDKNMFEGISVQSSKQELIEAIQHLDKTAMPRQTMKNPSHILDFIEKQSETIESLAIKADISERELLLAIRDSSDKATRTKIADALNMTYYSIFGK